MDGIDGRDDEQLVEALSRRDALAPVLMTGFVEARAPWGISITNDLGGTTPLPPGRYRVGVVRAFDDYETGGRMIGRLLDEQDVELARTTGTTGHSRTDLPAGGRTDLKGSEFRPALVYFSSVIFQPEVQGPAARGPGMGLR
jgi:hypothetical protein